MDTARYENYCRERYNYLQMEDRERKDREIAQDRTTVEVMIDTLLAALTCPLGQIKDVAINQAKRMALELKKQYRYVAALKKKILGALNQNGEVSLKQRNAIIGLVDQFLA